MAIGKYFEAEITKCSNPEDYWYADKEGEIVQVRRWTESSWGVEEKTTGGQIAPGDFRALTDRR